MEEKLGVVHWKSVPHAIGFNEVCYCEESPWGQYLGGKRGYATGILWAASDHPQSIVLG
jgi:hypothetical protein